MEAIKFKLIKKIALRRKAYLIRKKGFCVEVDSVNKRDNSVIVKIDIIPIRKIIFDINFI